MKSEAYYQGMRARLSELYKLGLDESCSYDIDSNEIQEFLLGKHEAKKAIESVNHSLSIFNESGINIKIQIEK
jgi:hypothetical protein